MVRDAEDCLLVEPTAAATADALDRLVRDRGLRRRLADGGRAFARGLTEGRMCEAFLRHVRESALAE
jgi:glycosyltransferase involved in cell wall biosynthesis